MEYVNKNPLIFVISGKARSGKNYIADIISNYYKNSIQISFAYYLKQYVKKITNWDGLDSTKPRSFLQSIGIDLIKKIDSKFLIRRVIEDIEVYSYFYDVIIITDARLKEEINDIKNNFKCVTIRVNGDNNDLILEQKNHITETDLDDYEFDYVINRNDDIIKILGGIK